MLSSPEKHRLLESIQLAVQALFHSGAPSIGRVAQAQGVSVRTLQRRLAELGITYSTLVDHARFDLAVRRFQVPQVRLRDVASELGFADAGSFTRAFRRWTGKAPPDGFSRHRPVPTNQ